MDNAEFERAFAIYRIARTRFRMRVRSRERFKEFFCKMDRGDQKICLEVWLEMAMRP
jgi:hypothetical protein